MTRVTYEIPTSLPSTANLREHWAAKAKRVKKLREDATAMAVVHSGGMAQVLLAMLFGPEPCATVVTLTRVAPRKLDDDNATAAMKPIRDSIASSLGVDDGDSRLTWKVEQEKGKPPRVRVSIEVREASARATEAR